jgi:energy-coupling factor transport system ATP-binding protein
MITHTMWVVAEYAHRVVVVDQGEVVMAGTTREVFAQDDALLQHQLRTPHIVHLSNQLGSTVLSVDELAECVDRKEVLA